MTCRRKTKSERELVADICKVFTNYCKEKVCKECKYKGSQSCLIDYLADILGEYEY